VATTAPHATLRGGYCSRIACDIRRYGQRERLLVPISCCA
jgi:hypothetical protein